MKHKVRKHFENCWCGSENFNINIGLPPKFGITLTCSKCQCKRRITTPKHACHYAIEPPLDGYGIVETTGKMYTTQKLKREPVDLIGTEDPNLL